MPELDFSLRVGFLGPGTGDGAALRAVPGVPRDGGGEAEEGPCRARPEDILA